MNGPTSPETMALVCLWAFLAVLVAGVCLASLAGRLDRYYGRRPRF